MRREGPVAYADVSSNLYRVDGDDNLSNASNDVGMARSFVATIEPGRRA